jgi:hypothetical protein
VPAHAASPRISELTVRSLSVSGPVVAVASDVAVAVGRSAHDCDRVSVWYAGLASPSKPAVRLGRATRCEPAGGITALSLIRNRAVWLQHSGGTQTRVWSLWTATDTQRTPTLLARASAPVGASAPFALGPGNLDRRQLFGDGDTLPWASGREVTVLRANGSTAYRWQAPATVTALGGDPGIVVVAVADGRIFELSGPTSAKELDGSPAARRVFWDGLGVTAVRGRTIDIENGGNCPHNHIPLPVGQDLLVASGGRFLFRHGPFVELRPGCGGAVELRKRASTATLDNDRLTYAQGRLVTTEVLFQ